MLWYSTLFFCGCVCVPVLRVCVCVCLRVCACVCAQIRDTRPSKWFRSRVIIIWLNLTRKLEMHLLKYPAATQSEVPLVLFIYVRLIAQPALRSRGGLLSCSQGRFCFTPHFILCSYKDDKYCSQSPLQTDRLWHCNKCLIPLPSAHNTLQVCCIDPFVHKNVPYRNASSILCLVESMLACHTVTLLASESHRGMSVCLDWTWSNLHSYSVLCLPLMDT